MKRVRITAMRRTEYRDLMENYENDISNACDIRVGDTWVYDGTRPQGLCESAWETLRPFVEELSRGGGDFYSGWMKNPHSAMLSCNDGFRPVTFYIEAIED